MAKATKLHACLRWVHNSSLNINHIILITMLSYDEHERIRGWTEQHTNYSHLHCTFNALISYLMKSVNMWMAITFIWLSRSLSRLTACLPTYLMMITIFIQRLEIYVYMHSCDIWNWKKYNIIVVWIKNNLINVMNNAWCGVLSCKVYVEWKWNKRWKKREIHKLFRKDIFALIPSRFSSSPSTRI